MIRHFIFNISKRWVQIAVIFVSVAVTVITLASSQDWHSLRTSVSTALQSTMVLFAVISALSIFLYANTVSGRNEKYSKQVSSIYALLEEIYDKYSDSEDPNIARIIEIKIMFLLGRDSFFWNDIDKVASLREKINDEIKESIERLCSLDKPHKFLYRLLLLDDALDELAVQAIGRHLASSYHDVIRNSFLIIIFVMLSNVFSSLLLDNSLINASIVVIDSILIALSANQVFQLLVIIEKVANEEVFHL